MADIEKKTIEQKIDKNKDQITDYVEIKDFILEDENQSENIKELGDYLNNLPERYYDEIRDNLVILMGDPEIIDIYISIEEKVNKNEKLNNDELSIIYLEAMLYGKYNGFINTGKFDLGLPIEKICNGYLLGYIQKRYNNYNYNPNKNKLNQMDGPVNKPQKVEKPYQNPLIPNPFPLESLDEQEQLETAYQGLPQIPEGKEIDISVFDKFLKWGNENYAPELIKLEEKAKDKHRFKDKKYLSGYIKYEKLSFILKKYYEIITKKDDTNIIDAGYANREDFEKEVKKVEEFNEFLKTIYGKSYLNYINQLTKIKNKYFEKEEDIIQAEKEYTDFRNEEKEIEEESGMDMAKVFNENGEMIEWNNLTEEDVMAILNYSIKMDDLREKYGDSMRLIKNYEGFMLDISKVEKVDESILKKINKLSSGIDFEKYNKYCELSSSTKTYEHIMIANGMQKVLTNVDDPNFPIPLLKEEKDQRIKEQEQVDLYRNTWKNNDIISYRVAQIISGLENVLVDGLLGTITALMPIMFRYDEDEMVSFNDRRGQFLGSVAGFAGIERRRSTSQSEPLRQRKNTEGLSDIIDFLMGFDPSEFHLTRDNVTEQATIGVGNMLLLIYGGGFIGAELGGGAIASKVGLFASSMFQQAGNSYLEGISGGLNRKQALTYSFLSSVTQSLLELVSPNDILLGKGSGLGKQLIKSICNNGDINGIKLAGKYILKTVFDEIKEENIQEALQLAAGNLINEIVNNSTGSNLDVDWSVNNFLETAIITTLTTGITTGFSAGKQGIRIFNSSQQELIGRVLSTPGLYEDVMKVLDNNLKGNLQIPNVKREQMQGLKMMLTYIHENQNVAENQTETQNQENENVEQNNVERNNETGKIRDIKEIISILTGREIQTINEYDIEEWNQFNIENLNKLASICEYYGIEFFHIEDIKLFEDNIDKLLEIKQQIESLGMTGLNDKLTTHFTASIESFEELIDILGENLYDSQLNETYKIIRNNQEVIKLLNDEKIKVNNISELQKILNLDLNEIQGCISIKNECKSNNIILGENDVDAILLLDKIGTKKMSEYINIQKSTLGIFVLDLNNQKGINNINKYSKSLITLVNLLSSKGICNIPWDDVLVQMLSETTTEQLQNIFDIEGICKNIQDYNFESFLYKLIIMHDEDIKNIPKIYNKIKDYCNIKIEDLNALAQIKEEDIDYNFLNLFKNKFSASELWYIFNRDIPLTENDYKILQKILDNGITINNSILKNFNKLTEQDIKNIKLLQGLGIDIQDCLNIKTLTEQDIENLKMLQEMGVNLKEYLNIKTLTEQDIENLKMLQEMGVDVTDYLGIKSVIEQIKTLTEQDIENLKMLQEMGVNLKEHLNIKPREQAEKVKSITNKVKSVIEQIKTLTEQDIENLKMLQELGVDIQDFSNIKLLTEQDIENLKMLQELNINFRNERRQPKQIKDILQDEINILKGLTETEIEFLKNDNKNLYEGYNKSKDEINIDHELKRGKIIGKFKQYLVEKTTSGNGNIIISEIIGRIRPELVTLSSQEIFDILIGIHKIQAKSNAINYYIDFENGPYKTPKELLCAIKGISDPNTIVKITDDINVIHYGTGIKFFIGDPESFYTINGGKREYIGGYYTPSSKIKELEGTVTIVNGQFTKEIDRIFKGIGTDQDIKILEWKTVIHEEQHNFDDYFMPESKEHDNMATIKDEIIAHMREGIEFKKIENALTSSYLHNYFSGKKLEEATTLTKELIKYANDLVELSNDPQTGLTKDIIISVLSDTPFEGRKDLHTRIMEAVKHKKTGESFRRAGTAEKETVINNLKNCNSIEEIKYILNDPQYSHIGWGTDNKGGIEISHIIDDVINRRLSISSIPTELSDIVKKFIK